MATISKLHYISQGTTPAEHLENIQQACVSGAELVQLRLKNISESVLLETAKKYTEEFLNSNESLLGSHTYNTQKNAEFSTLNKHGYN